MLIYCLQKQPIHQHILHYVFQAYYLAKVLSKKYRNKEKELWKIAEDCNKARIYAGLHYESDGEFSRRLVEKYF